MINGFSNEETIKWKKTCHKCGKRFEDSMTSIGGRFLIKVREFKVPMGECDDCRKKSHERFEIEQFATKLHWTFETVKQYFLDHPPYKGQELIVYDSGYHLHTYSLVKVDVPESGRQKRIIIEPWGNGHTGLSYYRSGKNCFAPTGQARLLPYHDGIGELLKKSPHGEIQLDMATILSIVGEKEPPKCSKTLL